MVGERVGGWARVVTCTRTPRWAGQGVCVCVCVCMCVCVCVCVRVCARSVLTTHKRQQVPECKPDVETGFWRV
jgi:hypothetical protein